MSRSRPPKCPNGRTRCICRDRVGARARAVEALRARADVVDGADEFDADPLGNDSGVWVFRADPND